MTERRRRLTAADQYRKLWASGPAASLPTFLATLPPLSPDELIDVIETDRHERWLRGDRVKAERYLRDYPGLAADTETALVLIYGEYYMRKERGETPSLMEYIARFPQHARRLRDQVMWHEALELGQGPAFATAPEIPGLAVGELLGRGGMCAVYQAVEEATAQVVAVKVLDIGHLHHPMRVARFRREVGSLMRLSHPHIVKAHRTGESGGLPFLVMEFCPGGTLAGRMRGRAFLPAVAANTLRALAGAVAYAHGEGVIHRDLKPQNILLAAGVRRPDAPAESQPSIPKIADFGLAKCKVDMGGSLTASRETLGTPCYMAPELATGARDADARTDVYGLGAILYELLTGRPPFVANSPMEVVRMVREEPPVPPAAINSDVPAPLEAVCLKCLEKDPDWRYQSAADVGEATRAE
jgi:eukaryotic-like serine/threonine-protein kinase